MRRRKPGRRVMRAHQLDAASARPIIHALGCRCKRCRHPELPADLLRRAAAANRWARNTFIGLGLGVAAAQLVDWIVGGPGILSIFGVGL